MVDDSIVVTWLQTEKYKMLLIRLTVRDTSLEQINGRTSDYGKGQIDLWMKPLASRIIVM